MTYLLGIDLGTTFTAAAICRSDAADWGPPQVVQLGTRHAAVSSAAFQDQTGVLLFGDAAERRVVTDPSSVVREFKRRVGDDTPIFVGDTPWTAEDLLARLAHWVVATVSTREGEPPRTTAITHPAGWGEHRRSLLAAALHRVGLADVVLLSEPHAAAIHHATTKRVDVGATIAVYDFGGGTFDATVLRKTGDDAFEQAGQPTGHDRLGGMDFDDLVFEHVRAAHPDAFAAVDPRDPRHVAAIARLRRECTEAKEALSEDTETVIPVLLPHHQAQTRLVRAEFEDLIRPAVEETVTLLRAAVGSADIESVLLAGGSARIPLVTELLSAEFGRPVVADTDPKAAVALGAVLALRSMERTAALPTEIEAAAAPPERPVIEDEPLAVPPQRRRLRLPAAKLLVVAAGLVVAVVTVSTLTDAPERLTSGGAPAQAATRTGQQPTVDPTGGGPAATDSRGYTRDAMTSNAPSGTGTTPRPATGTASTNAGAPAPTSTPPVAPQAGTPATTPPSSTPTTTPTSAPISSTTDDPPPPTSAAAGS
jgi:actin-like ATPase involved in cell morphogenesis